MIQTGEGDAPAHGMEELRRRVDAVDNWWHRIDLGHGIVTPGRQESSEKLARIHMPRDLSGQTVLDIGTSDGFFAFEAERRGAERVVASDWWMHPGIAVHGR